MKASVPTLTHHPDPRLEPTYCTLGDTLCRIRFFTEAEWDAVPTARRPAGAVHRPGSGWVAPVKVHGFF